MNCPKCRQLLPFHFAFASGLRKRICPACHGILIPTKTSIEKVKKVCWLISFFSGIPLGGLCSYVWIGTGQFGLAMFSLLLGMAGVMGSTYFYARSNISFRLV